MDDVLVGMHGGEGLASLVTSLVSRSTTGPGRPIALISAGSDVSET